MDTGETTTKYADGDDNDEEVRVQSFYWPSMRKGGFWKVFTDGFVPHHNISRVMFVYRIFVNI